MPLFQLIERHVLAAERLHGDDTTIRIPGEGQVHDRPDLDLFLWLYGDATSLDEIRGSAPNYVDEL